MSRLSTDDSTHSSTYQEEKNSSNRYGEEPKHTTYDEHCSNRSTHVGISIKGIGSVDKTPKVREVYNKVMVPLCWCPCAG